MKKLKITSAILLAFLGSVTGLAQSPAGTGNPAGKNDAGISVYYFHFNARCVTCRAVESETKADIEALFGDDVTFTALNLDEASGKEKGHALGVSGQTLLVVKGDKKINLTSEGFLYARTDPEKFRQIISDTIKPLL